MSWSEAGSTVWHFRDRSGVEVDLLVEHPDGRVAGFEVKATRTPRAEDLRGLRFLADRLGDRFWFGACSRLLLKRRPSAPGWPRSR